MKECAQKIADTLNQALEADRAMLWSMRCQVYPANQTLTDHPTIMVHQCPEDPTRTYTTFMNLINSAFIESGIIIGEDWSEEAVDESGRHEFRGFVVTDYPVDEVKTA